MSKKLGTRESRSSAKKTMATQFFLGKERKNRLVKEENRTLSLYGGEREGGFGNFPSKGGGSLNFAGPLIKRKKDLVRGGHRMNRKKKANTQKDARSWKKMDRGSVRGTHRSRGEGRAEIFSSSRNRMIVTRREGGKCALAEDFIARLSL